MVLGVQQGMWWFGLSCFEIHLFLKRIMLLIIVFATFQCLFVSSVPVRRLANRRNTFYYDFGDGYYYHINRKSQDVAYLKCIHYEKGCWGRAVWRRGGIFYQSQAHEEYCIQDPMYPQVMELRRRILERCRRLEMTPFTRIIEDERAGFPEAVQVRCNYRRMRNSMRNARLSSLPPPPETLREFSNLLRTNPNLQVATMTEDGTGTMYAASVTAGDGTHSIIFTSRRSLEYARNQPIFFGDGTFSAVPPRPEAYQIFTVVTTHHHNVVPIAWFLMESKSYEAYEATFRVFRALLGPEIALQIVITDHEATQQLAWSNVFNVEVQGCLWHMARAFVRHAKRRLGLFRYMARGPVREIIRLCFTLALMPFNLVRRAFLLIMQHARRQGAVIYRRVRPFLLYVLTYWLNSPSRRRWMNCCGSEHRTNNISESHNRQLNRYVGNPHPNIYVFVSALARMEQVAHINIVAIRMGVRMARPRRWTSVYMDERLRNYLTDLEPHRLNDRVPILRPGDDAIWRYMRRASYLFQNVYDNALAEL